MPLELIPTILSVIGAGATATGVGLSLANSSDGSSTSSSTPNPASVLGYVSSGDQNSDVSSLVSNIQNLIGQTGGGLNPNSYGSVAGTESGLSSQTGLIQQAIAQALGNSGISSGAATTPTPSIAMALNKSKGLVPTAPGLTLQSPF